MISSHPSITHPAIQRIQIESQYLTDIEPTEQEVQKITAIANRNISPLTTTTPSPLIASKNSSNQSPQEKVKI